MEYYLTHMVRILQRIDNPALAMWGKKALVYRINCCTNLKKYYNLNYNVESKAQCRIFFVLYN